MRCDDVIWTTVRRHFNVKHLQGSNVVFVGWLVVFGLNDPLRQYFSLYRVVSQREGERGEKG